MSNTSLLPLRCPMTGEYREYLESGNEMIICIEGCNATGKSFAIAEFSYYLEQKNITYRVYKAPDYYGVNGYAITDFLAGSTLSGNYMYESGLGGLSEEEKERAAEDFRVIDKMFRENRDAVFGRIQDDYQREPVDVVLLDRWIMSSVAYSFMRFQDIYKQPDDSYYDYLISGERIPDVTIVIEEPAEVIVSRMNSRIAKTNTSIPKVWRQSAACYDRIMNVFRLIYNESNSKYCFYTNGESVQYRLITSVAKISNRSQKDSGAGEVTECNHDDPQEIPAERLNTCEDEEQDGESQH